MIIGAQEEAKIIRRGAMFPAVDSSKSRTFSSMKDALDEKIPRRSSIEKPFNGLVSHYLQFFVNITIHPR